MKSNCAEQFWNSAEKFTIVVFLTVIIDSFVVFLLINFISCYFEENNKESWSAQSLYFAKLFIRNFSQGFNYAFAVTEIK